MNKQLKIPSKDVTFLVHGVFNKHTQKLIKSIVKNFPESPIILSTWENQTIPSLKNVEIIFNKDPGGYRFDIRHNNKLKLKMGFNTNRMLTTIKKGLENVSTKYCCRLRNDMFFVNDNLLKYDLKEMFPIRNKDYIFFNQRVIYSSLFSFLYDKFPFARMELYKLSDWMNFGLTSDLKKLFDNIPLIANEKKFIDSFVDQPLPNNLTIPIKLWPEQYFFVKSFQSKFSEIEFNNFFHLDSKQLTLFLNLYVSNVVCLSSQEMGVYNQKYRFISKFGRFIFFNWFDLSHFIYHYQTKLDPNYLIKRKYLWRFNKISIKFQNYLNLIDFLNLSSSFLKRFGLGLLWITVLIFYWIILPFFRFSKLNKK